MAETIDTCIGRLTEVQESRMTAMLTHDEGFPHLDIEGRQVAVGQIGSYLVIRQGAIQVVAMVVRASEEERALRVSLGERGDGTVRRSVTRGLLHLVPLGELDEALNFQRGVVNYPVPGAEVHVVVEDELDALFKAYRNKRYELGFLPSLPSVKLFLDPSPLFGRHLAILGQSGSGKSWSVTSLLQRAVQTMPNAHIILLDLHGEYVWTDEHGVRQSAFEEQHYRYVDARDLEIPYWLLTYAELVDLLIDRNDDKASTQMAFLREVLLALRRKANKEMQGVNISIDSPVYFSLSELFHQFKRANEQVTDFGKVKGPLYGQFDEFLIKMQARFNDVRYDFLFKPKRRKSSGTLADLLRDFVGLRNPKRQITVVDFSPVPFDVRPTVSAQVGRLAFEFNYWNPQCREFPLFVVAEEAHAYIPRDHVGGHQGTRRSFERIAKAGRKYAVGLCVVSQRPNELSETVLAQCSSFVCLRISNPDDQEYVRSLVPDSARGILEALTSLAQGEAIGAGEAVPMPVRFKVTMPDPPPNAQSIEYGKMWATGPEDTDVDHIVDCWRRQRR